MKLTSSIVVVSILLTSALGGLAAEKTSQAAPAKPAKVRTKAAKVHKPEQVALTGSYIKRDIRRNGMVTDGSNPVVVLDQAMIRNSGAADLRQLLVVKGLSR